jgi:hypothetical protein
MLFAFAAACGVVALNERRAGLDSLTPGLPRIVALYAAAQPHGEAEDYDDRYPRDDVAVHSLRVRHAGFAFLAVRSVMKRMKQYIIYMTFYS